MQRLINSCSSVFYTNHHRAGDIPATKLLESHIDLDANTCTSLIVYSLLNVQYHSWAIAAACGDNLIVVGDKLTAKASLSPGEVFLLKELGTLIKYNDYGATN